MRRRRHLPLRVSASQRARGLAPFTEPQVGGARERGDRGLLTSRCAGGTQRLRVSRLDELPAEPTEHDRSEGGEDLECRGHGETFPSEGSESTDRLGCEGNECQNPITSLASVRGVEPRPQHGEALLLATEHGRDRKTLCLCHVRQRETLEVAQEEHRAVRLVELQDVTLESSLELDLFHQLERRRQCLRLRGDAFSARPAVLFPRLLAREVLDDASQPSLGQRDLAALQLEQDRFLRHVIRCVRVVNQASSQGANPLVSLGEIRQWGEWLIGHPLPNGHRTVSLRRIPELFSHISIIPDGATRDAVFEIPQRARRTVNVRSSVSGTATSCRVPSGQMTWS